MKVSPLQQSLGNRRASSLRSVSAAPDSTSDGSAKSPAVILHLLLHVLCCLVSLLLGFCLSRAALFFLLSATPSTNLHAPPLRSAAENSVNSSHDPADLADFPSFHLSVHAKQFLVTNLSIRSEPSLLHLVVSAAPWDHCRQFLQEICCAPDIKLLIASLEKETDDDESRSGFRSLFEFLSNQFSPDDLLDKVMLLLEEHHNGLSLSLPDGGDGKIRADLRLAEAIAGEDEKWRSTILISASIWVWCLELLLRFLIWVRQPDMKANKIEFLC